MLLACCFREPSKKKHKKNKNWKNEKVRDSEEYVLSKSLLSTPQISSAINKSIENTKLQVDFLDSNHPQERHLSPEKQIKLKKEKEELKSKRRSFQADYVSTTFTNISTIQCQKDHQLVPRDVSRMFASVEDLDGSLLSVSTAHQSFKISNQSLESSFEPPATEVFITNNLPTNEVLSNGETKTIKSNSHDKKGDSNSKSEEIPEEAVIDEQIRNEEKAAKDKERDDFIMKIREESEKSFEALKIQHQIELEKVKDAYDVKLLEEKENHLKDLEANTFAKNAANETICQLNQQIILEREKVFAAQEDNSKHLEQEFRMKNVHLSQSLKQIEVREQAWQDERADVLQEVQRLKAETTRMVKILAMDFEEDNLSKDKKRSLSQEVYSLQLVVEMRTGEVRDLREQLARATQELEEAETTKKKLGKATARMEDLEEQVKMKNQIERQLSVEKSQLELKVTSTSKQVDRMSKNVETLQWRIRNNFDLPVDNLTPVTSDQLCQDKQRNSLPEFSLLAFFADENKSSTPSITKCPQSTPVTDKKFEFSQRKPSFSMVSDEVIQANVIDEVNDKTVTHDCSPSSDVFCSTVDIPKIKSNSPESERRSSDSEINDNKDHQFNHLNEDVDSVDEGVGDISSDGEHPDNQHFEDINSISNNNNNSGKSLEREVHMCNSSTTSPANERIASRFTFDKIN